MNMIPEMLAKALEYGQMGFPVHPLHTVLADMQGMSCTCKYGNECKHPGKHPKLIGWPQKAATNPEVIRKLWEQNPQSNIGIVTGSPSGLLVLDIDKKNGKDGFLSLNQLIEEFGTLPETACAKTGSGGMHYYFRYQGPPVPSSSGIMPGLDIRAEGGFIVAPPSLHYSGQYIWVIEPGDDGSAIAQAPEELVNFLLSHQKRESSNDGPILEGTRNTTLTSLAGRLRHQNLGREEILEVLKSVNAKRCNPPLDDSELDQIASSVSKYEPSPLYSNENIIHAPDTQAKKLKENLIAAKIADSGNFLTDQFNITYEYKEGIWKPLHPWQLEALASQHDTVKDVTSKRCKEITFHLKNYTRKVDFRWNNLKRGEVPLKNGIFDVFTGLLRPHRREDYLEAIFPVEYNPEARCPIFDDFLLQSAGDDPQKILAIEEMMGYLLMLDTPYKTAFLCHGPADTGKTVLQSVMAGLVGQDKVCQIALDKLENPSEIAPIKGKALNIMSELKYGTRLSDDGFKRLVSTGEPVQLNQKYIPRETYTPYCKHAIFTNELPHITDLSEATYRRLLIVSFPHVVPKDKQDPNLKDKLMQEMSGILLLALVGLKRLIENDGRFTLPKDHLKWIQQIKEDSNPINEILASYFTKTAGGYTSMTGFRELITQKYPHLRKYSAKRITQLLKAAGCEVRETSRSGQKGTFLLDYNPTRETYQWLQSKLTFPITGYVDPIDQSMA